MSRFRSGSPSEGAPVAALSSTDSGKRDTSGTAPLSCAAESPKNPGRFRSLTAEFRNLLTAGGGQFSPIKGVEADFDLIPFGIFGGPEALFAPDLHTVDISLGVVTVKVFTGPRFHEIRGIAGVPGLGAGFSIVRGGFTPFFVRPSPLE